MTSRIGQPDTDADLRLRECLDQTPLTSFVMVAGAGSGKTTSLVKALGHLAQTKSKDLQRRGQQIACITYTEVAVGEIWGDVGNAPLFHVSTIHSFLWNAIRPFQKDLKDWVAARIEEKIAGVREKINKPRTQARTREKATADIERYQAQLAGLARVPRFTYGTGSNYAKGILGHDDILKMGPELITARPLLRTLIANRFPFIFVDESQDTNPTVVDALRQIASPERTGFCLGFFGDPMQKIYTAGAGPIPLGANWNGITKPENFRCPTTVLQVINRIRAEDDRLEQVRGRHTMRDGVAKPVTGTARLFIVPADARRSERLAEVRHWLAKANNDPLWENDNDEGDVRVLVLVHSMAARRLGFADVCSALYNGAPLSLKGGFRDGSTWVLRPFLTYLLPLVQAARAGAHFDVIGGLRANCPLLSEAGLAGQNAGELLTRLKGDVDRLCQMLATDSVITVRDILLFVRDRELASLDDRFARILDAAPGPDDGDYDAGAEDAALAAFFACPATQLWGYRTYIEDHSPFATQQGVKGAEFQRVLVVLDDEEGDYNLFSYGKYFGITSLSEKDEENLRIGSDSVIGRTRRLLYVCCSRAVKDLAVVLIVPDITAARKAVIEKRLFEEADVHLIA